MKEIEIRRRHRRHQVSPSQQRVPVRAPMGGNTEQFFGAATAAKKFLVVVRKGGRGKKATKPQQNAYSRFRNALAKTANGPLSADQFATPRKKSPKI